MPIPMSLIRGRAVVQQCINGNISKQWEGANCDHSQNVCYRFLKELSAGCLTIYKSQQFNCNNINKQ